MKTAIITSKNEFGQLINKGKAILGAKMDSRADQGFYEYKFADDPKGITHCDWIFEDDIKIEEV